MSRETFDRNVEKVAPRKDAEIVNKFIGEAIRNDATAEVAYLNNFFTQVAGKMKELGIKKGTKESSLIQKFGEGSISRDELQKESPNKWKEIESAVSYFQEVYEKTIDDWNKLREVFDYPPVPKLTNFFPHFKDISFWTKTYGFLDNNDKLPTSIAGRTETFKPGKVFSRHELHRTGGDTTYDAIQGAEIYLKSVAKQMFSMNGIARADALLQYIEKSAIVGEATGKKLDISGFKTNLIKYLDGQLRGKTVGLDKFFEDYGDRRVVNSTLAVSKLIGRNIIAFNPATSLTHLVSIPLNLATVDKVSFIKGMMTTVSMPFSDQPIYSIDGQQSKFLFRRYPIEHIMRSKFESVEAAGGWMLQQMDMFKARTAVASKYYELIDKGMSPEDAIKKADDYAARIIGDYSTGQRPNLLSQKSMSLFAQFQLGMNDALSVISHDIPYENKKIGADGII